MNKETHLKALEIINVINVQNKVLALILDCTRQSVYNKKHRHNDCYFNANDLKKLQDYKASLMQLLKLC